MRLPRSLRSLAMTKKGSHCEATKLPKQSHPFPCHCEERSDEAIPSL